MSQFYQATTAGSLPPSVPTSFVTDDGTAIPAGNILNVNGADGIVTSANPDGSNNLVITLQNSFVDQAQTIGATTADITTVPLTVAGTYTFESRVAAWESTGPNGAGFSINGVVRSDGATATLIGDSDGFTHQDVALNNTDVNLVVSGNNAVIRVLGEAGLTVNWGSLTVYVFRGA